MTLVLSHATCLVPGPSSVGHYGHMQVTPRGHGAWSLLDMHWLRRDDGSIVTGTAKHIEHKQHCVMHMRNLAHPPSRRVPSFAWLDPCPAHLPPAGLRCGCIVRHTAIQHTPATPHPLISPGCVALSFRQGPRGGRYSSSTAGPPHEAGLLGLVGGKLTVTLLVPRLPNNGQMLDHLNSARQATR